MNITSDISSISVKIYVNDILHIYFLRDKFQGFQSWQWEAEGLFYIEITLENKSIECDYDNREMWLGILKELDRLA